MPSSRGVSPTTPHLAVPRQQNTSPQDKLLEGLAFLTGRLTFLTKVVLKLDWDQCTKEVGSIAPFIIPFMKMTCVYFILDLPEDDPSMTAAFVKALPILSLAWLVCLQGVKYVKTTNNDYITYNRRILYGLLFSCVGDVLLIWQRYSIYFNLGMLSFAGTQVCYILAFGIHPFGLKELVPCLLGLLGTLAMLMPCVPSGILNYLVPIYAILIASMMWRSLACFQFNGDIPWRKIFSAIGAILFVISDCCIAVNKFCFPIPFERMLIMGTYYSAQMCISLSAINSHLHSTSSSSSRRRQATQDDRDSDEDERRDGRGGEGGKHRSRGHSPESSRSRQRPPPENPTMGKFAAHQSMRPIPSVHTPSFSDDHLTSDHHASDHRSDHHASDHRSDHYAGDHHTSDRITTVDSEEELPRRRR